MREGLSAVKIAIPYDAGNIAEHFGNSRQFKIYDVSKGTILSSAVVWTDRKGHCAQADFLHENHVDVVVCGAIGLGAKAAVASAGMLLYCGIHGDADDAVIALLKQPAHSSP